MTNPTKRDVARMLIDASTEALAGMYVDYFNGEPWTAHHYKVEDMGNQTFVVMADGKRFLVTVSKPR